MSKKILITGGAGFIGSHIADEFIKKEYEVIIVDNLTTGQEKNINSKARFYNCDITSAELEQIFSAETPEIVIHLAAQVSVPNATKDPIGDAHINIIGTLNVLKYCKAYGVKKILAASSAAVYGEPQYLPVDEAHPTIPISNYGISKLTMEKYIENSGVDYIIFRFSNVFGERQTAHGEAGVVTIFENAMKNNLPVTIFGDGEQIRDFIYVKDIAKITCNLAISDVKNETINVSTNTECTINELFKILADKYGYQQAAVYKPERNGDIKVSILANSKLNSLAEVEYTDIRGAF